MLRVRVIPVLLLKNGGLVKGRQFKDHKYLGDPINAVKIFNEKEVDELVFLDISATQNNRPPNFELIEDIASEAFMPFGYGGGITTIEQIERLFSLGVEKVILNSSAFYRPELLTEAVRISGSQSIVVSMDVKKTIFGKYEVYIENGSKRTKIPPVEYAKNMESIGVGEVILNCVDREGTEKGYDLFLLERVSEAVNIPVVAVGGAGKLIHFKDAVNKGHASAVAAGNMFVFHGKHKAVLITYPEYNKLTTLFENK
jgi:imidazole glycerol-phosphate synthase subunit HisF